MLFALPKLIFKLKKKLFLLWHSYIILEKFINFLRHLNLKSFRQAKLKLKIYRVLTAKTFSLFQDVFNIITI